MYKNIIIQKREWEFETFSNHRLSRIKENLFLHSDDSDYHLGWEANGQHSF